MEIKSASDLVRVTRGALAAAGFTRNERDGIVWWTGGQETSPVLVLVHGANDHAGTWFMAAPYLARTHRVILPDLAGHGESEPKTGSIPLSLILERLEAVIADERDITLLGNSLGGWIALHYTLRHRDRVLRLLLESSGGLNRPLSSPLSAQNREEALVVLRAVHGPKYQPQDWVIDALIQRATDSPMLRLTEVLEHDIESRLGEIDVPTTLIWGADDGVLPLDYAQALQQAIPNSQLRVIEGAAHIPHLQQPERFLQCLTATS